MFKAVEVKPGIFWVGVIEWNERCIHGFTMGAGSTNNAYLIVDEKVALIDTCSVEFADELLERVASVIDPAKIDLVVTNHGEKDHAGSLRRVLEAAPKAQVVVSDPKGVGILERYGIGGGEGDLAGRTVLPVKSGDALSIGKRTLTFIHTPMVHWPDNMVTWCAEDSILFSNDAFGQFWATSERFSDQVDAGALDAAAKKYFANIVMPFARQAQKATAAVSELGAEVIAPSHGLIWRGSGVERILERYRTWCALEPHEAAVVAYSSMYGSTERLALAMAEAFAQAGVSVRLFDLDVSDISDIMTLVMDAKYVCVGSATHNKTLLPKAGEFLTYLKGLVPKGRVGIPFGSYGWADGAAREIAGVMEGCGFSLPLEVLDCAWNTTITDEEAAFNAITTLVKGWDAKCAKSDRFSVSL